MTQRVLSTTCAIAILLITTSLQAQSGLAKFKQRLDELKPKGTLIKQIFNIEDKQPQPKPHSTRQPKPPAQVNQQRFPKPSVSPGNQKATNTRNQPVQLAPAFQTRFPKSRTPAKPVKEISVRKPTPRTTAPLTSPKQASSAAKKNVGKLGAKFKQTPQGIVIADVASTSTAGQAGLQPNDILLSFAGMKIENTSELFEIAGALQDGDQIEIKVQRAGKSEELLLTMGDSPSDDSPAQPAARLETSDSEIAVLRETVQRQQKLIAELEEQIRKTQDARIDKRTAASEIPLAN